MEEKISRLIDILSEAKILIGEIESFIKIEENKNRDFYILDIIDNNKLGSELLRSKTKRAMNALKVRTVSDLQKYHKDDILSLHNIGKKVFLFLQESLQEELGIWWE